MRSRSIAGLALFAIPFVFHLLAEPAEAAGVVGTGTPASCTEAALDAALVGGGAVNFNCGAAPASITLTSHKTIANNATTTTINGGNLITLSGGNSTRLFVVPGLGSLTLNNITITKGLSAGGDGGAIYNVGTLNINNSLFIDNQTTPNYSGGAIVSYGPLNITNSEFTENKGGGGGAIYPRFSLAVTLITGSSFHDNEATNAAGSGWGGALLMWDGAPVTINSSTFANNKAESGGAIYVFDRSTLTINNSQITTNAVIRVSSAIPTGGGGVHNSGASTLNNVTLSGNSADFFGGGIFNDVGSTLITRSTITENTSPYSGGIHNWSGTLFVLYTAITANHGTNGGVGGFDNRIGATAVLSYSTIDSNTGSPYGGIYNSGSMDLTNVTVSGNSGGSEGGIITRGPLSLISVTIAGNTGSQTSGIYHFGSSATTLKNTIISQGAAGPNCVVQADSATVISSTGFNLSSDTSCAAYFNKPGDQNNTPAGLRSLTNNGGSTRTHRPSPGSAAIDNGTNAGCPVTDQRDLARPIGLACDVGAVEVQLSELATTTPTATVTATRTTTPTATNTATPTRTPTSTLTPSLTSTPVPGAPTATITLTSSLTPTASITATPPPTTAVTPTPTTASIATSPPSPTQTINLPPSPTTAPDTLNRVSVYLQDTVDGFQTDVAAQAANTLPLPVGGLRAVQVALGDLTGDGRPELIAIGVNDQGAGVRVSYPNLGGGLWGAPGVYPSNGTPVALALADVSQNGVVDVAIATGNGAFGQIEYFPDGALVTPSESTFVAGQPIVFAVERLTDDASPDYVVATQGGTTAQVMRQAPGTGPLQDSCGIGGTPRRLLTGRSNLSTAGVVDNDLDLFVALANGILVIENSVQTGPPPVGFCPLGGTTLTLGAGLDVLDLTLADLNADGRLDIVALTANPVTVVSFLAGTTPGTYGAGVASAVAANAVGIGVLTTGAGAPPNLVVAHTPGSGQAGNGTLSILQGTAAGSFALVQNRPLTCGVNPSLRVATGDVNGDGRTDFAVSGCLPVADAATPTPTGTPTPTVSRTATPTATRIPGATTGTLGGYGFSLETNPGSPALARWTGGTQQTGYQGLRIALPSSAYTFFPGGGAALPADATSYADSTPGDIGCYLTIVLGGNPPGTVVYGNTDAICLFRGVASGSAPLSFRAQLNQSTTTSLSWTAAGGQSGYTLVIIPTDGSPITFRNLGAGVTNTTHETGGGVICYQLQTLGVAGQTDALCSFPNASTIGSGGVAVRDVLERLVNTTVIHPGTLRP